MNDIKLESKNYIFKYRVSGAMIVNNKLLTVQIMDNGFYCLPGGHVISKETSSEAIKREMEEEVNCKVEVANMFAVAENIFKRADETTVQELGMYYFIKPDKQMSLDNKTIIEENDGIKKKLEFKWIALDDLDKENFKPKFLIEQLKKQDSNLKYYSFKQN